MRPHVRRSWPGWSVSACSTGRPTGVTWPYPFRKQLGQLPDGSRKRVESVAPVLRQLRRIRWFTVSTLVAFGATAQAQMGTPIASPFPGPDESFEVASVRPNRSGALQWDFDAPPGRVVGTNVVLRDLIRFAYNIY